MSATPANLKVEFIANVVGAHRACYRLAGSSGAYTCVEGTCEVLGECVIYIPIFVDNETCEEVGYEIYVQATCNELSSTAGRVPQTGTFTPSPSCKSYLITCTSLEVESITVTNGGSGYNPSVPPTVSVVGSGSAVANATVGAGSLSAAVITNPGTNYTSGTYTNVNIMGGTGSGALATVVVTGGVVTSVTITNGGTGYTSGGGFVYNLDATDMGPSTPDIAAEISVTNNYGTVISIAVMSSGLFTDPPTVLVAPPVSGTNALATAVMEDCPEINSAGCSGADINISAGALTGFGENVVVCGHSIPTMDPSYTVSENGNCLCNCTTTTLSAEGTAGQQVRYFYNKCGTTPMTGVLTVGGSPSSLIDCIVPGSLTWITVSGATLEAEYGDDC